MHTIHPTSPEDDRDLATLLQRAGARDRPPAQVQAAVWAAVHAAWREMVRARKQRRRWSMAAAVAIIAGVTLLVLSALQPAPVKVATVEPVDGRQGAANHSTGTPLPLAEILTIVAQRAPGNILEIDLEHDDAGTLMYGIKVLGADGQVRKLKIDANSGVVVQTKTAESD